METLQELGVQGPRIHVVLTLPELAASCLGDPQVEKAVLAALEKAGVRVHQDCLLAHMNQGEAEVDPLTCVSFTTNAEPLHLQCGVSGGLRRLCTAGVHVHPSYVTFMLAALVF